VDGAGEDLFARAAFAGDEDVDVGAGDALGEGHELAHVAGDDGAVAVDREVLDWPEGCTPLPLHTRAFEVVNGLQQQPHRIQTRSDSASAFECTIISIAWSSAKPTESRRSCMLPADARLMSPTSNNVVSDPSGSRRTTAAECRLAVALSSSTSSRATNSEWFE